MAEDKKQKHEKIDLLVGMNAICAVLGVSEATVLKWRREYEDFPVKSNGRITATRAGLQSWAYKTFGGE